MKESIETELYLSSDKDELFHEGPWPKSFVFNDDVVKVFDDMVSRSVPLYREVIAAAVHWTRAYFQEGSRIVDVGCSTGTFLELVGRFLKEPATLVGLDNSQAMLERAKEKLAEISNFHHVELLCEDAIHSSYEESSVVIMNYTLQFLPFSNRLKLLTKIHDEMLEGGLLFLSEKVKSSHPQLQETMTLHYEAFKERNGYARTEIERKKEALENVLVPLTYEQQVDMLYDAGFKHVDVLMKLHHFTTFVVVK